jgi:hypothetical protein
MTKAKQKLEELMREFSRLSDEFTKNKTQLDTDVSKHFQGIRR